MNNLSIMLFPYHRGLIEGEWTAAELLHTFRGAGITGIELMQNAVWKDPKKWAEFDAAAKAEGMVYNCYDVMVNLVGENETEREQAIQAALTAIAYARDTLACPTVLLAGTKPATGMDETEGRRVYAESLARVIDTAGDCGVTVTIEDFGVYPRFTAAGAHCLDVLEAVNRDRMRFTFDNGNFLLGGDRPMDAFDALYPYTSHVHIKDFTPREPDGKPSLTSSTGIPYKGCLIGAGDGQVRTCVRKLKEVGYTGWISLEMGGGDVIAEAIHGARVVSETWEQA
jgi:sugar phosphate isomerase/epimerase